MVLLLAIAGIGGALVIYQIYARDLPDYRALANYQPPTTTRVHAGDGRLLAEYATQNRLFVPITVIPKLVVDAFLAAEDKNFYTHSGIDPDGVARALVTGFEALSSGRRPQGGSTITQQVAKNMLLGNEMSISRKVREAILAVRIENALSKDRILELYLNEIYLGFGSYGVAAASLNYFNKSLDDLTVAEAAYLAGLPKAPNNYHPIRLPAAAKSRRDFVITRMMEDGRIDADAGRAAMSGPVVTRKRDETETVSAPWFAEEVRRDLQQRYGDRMLYEGGLLVRTSLDPKLQAIADKVMRAGLMTYDRRHGWRGPLGKLHGQDFAQAIRGYQRPAGLLPTWETAVVTQLAGDGARIVTANGQSANVPFSEMAWARQWGEGQSVGAAPRRPSDVVSVGDVIAVEPVSGSGSRSYPDGTFALRQMPAVDGALVAMDPFTGRVLAMTGGFSPERSEFNRATQAWRQPGSSFKPFVYLAALEKGYTPATMILDAPFVMDQGPGLPKWKPSNYSGDFGGVMPLRMGVEKSKNLMTVRLADNIGMDTVVQYATRFGIADRMAPVLAMSLGAGETTVLRLTTAYAMLANGGKKIQPSIIDRIQDRNGTTVFKADRRNCSVCDIGPDTGPPELPDEREQIADPASVYQIVSILQGVVERGTATVVKSVGKPLAGKTGTTNDSFDTWFMGFGSNLAVGVFVGFDNPRTLGAKETGGSVSAPIFRDFMQAALEFYPATPFRVPPGIRFMRISESTGLAAQPGDSRVIMEAFKPGTEPTGYQAVIGGGSIPTAALSDGAIPTATIIPGGATTVGSGLY
jgi:penicillin-binding protein 1A